MRPTFYDSRIIIAVQICGPLVIAACSAHRSSYGTIAATGNRFERHRSIAYLQTAWVKVYRYIRGKRTTTARSNYLIISGGIVVPNHS